MSLLNALRRPVWAALFALILLSGCGGSENTAPEGSQEVVAQPPEEVPPPEPDEDKPEPPLQNLVENAEPESTKPQSKEAPEDLTADLDAFFGTEPEESKPPTDSPADETGDLFGELMAGGATEPEEALAEPEPEDQPVETEALAMDEPVIAEVELPDQPEDPLVGLPAEPVVEPLNGKRAPDFSSRFPPLTLDDSFPAAEAEPKPTPNSGPRTPIDPEPEAEPTFPAWTPLRPAEPAESVEPAAEQPVEASTNSSEEEGHFDGLFSREESEEEEVDQTSPAEESPVEPMAVEAEELPVPPLPPTPAFDLPEEEPVVRSSPPPPRRPKRPTLDVNNTRHLAWMLGAKMSLLAASEADVQLWEVDALAEMLGVQPAPLDLGGDQQRNVSRLLKAAAAAGNLLNEKFGAEHAALLEIAVKSNAVATLYAERPELAVPVAAAIKKASDRAGLDPTLCAPLHDTLRGKPTAEQVREAVFAMHASIAEALQQP